MSKCPEAAYGVHGDPDRRGLCPWCRCRLGPPMSRPRRMPSEATDSQAYRYYYDPDYGNERYEVYE